MFKILSKSEYEKLVAAALTDTDVSELEYGKLERAHFLEIEKFKRERELLEEDHKIAMERKTAEVDLLVQKAEKKLKDEVQKLTIECSNYKKEVEILTKAFENMGFDVKDMKEILNKLVDGIVSKNQIQLVK